MGLGARCVQQLKPMKPKNCHWFALPFVGMVILASACGDGESSGTVVSNAGTGGGKTSDAGQESGVGGYGGTGGDAATGGTGASARSGLQQELLTSREFFVATHDEAVDFILEGSSIGGRMDGRLLDKKGKQLFERSYAAPGLDENIKALADDIIYTITGKPGLATSRIVFISEFHSGSFSGTNCRQLIIAFRKNRTILTNIKAQHNIWDYFNY